jgi:hypothetical protein
MNIPLTSGRVGLRGILNQSPDRNQRCLSRDSSRTCERRAARVTTGYLLRAVAFDTVDQTPGPRNRVLWLLRNKTPFCTLNVRYINTYKLMYVYLLSILFLA